MIKKTRKFLKKNEVFFTTIATLLLSIMAVALTINSNRLTKTQIDLDRSINQPDFYVTHEYIIDESSNKIDEVELRVKKLSGIAKNIKITHSSLFEVRFEDSLNRNISNTFQLQQFLNQSRSGYDNETGIIKIIKGYKNNLRQREFRNGIENKLEQMGYMYVFTNITTIIKIEYIDFSSKIKSEFYESSFRDGRKLEGAHDQLLEVKNSIKQIYLDDIERMDLDDVALRIVSTS